MVSSNVLSPSSSRSNSSIIARNSSSLKFSPKSRATRFKLRKLILPVLSSSNNLNARRISSIGSRLRMRSPTAC